MPWSSSTAKTSALHVNIFAYRVWPYKDTSVALDNVSFTGINYTLNLLLSYKLLF